MLAIGRALMTNPKLLILDEATEGLAPLIRQEIWDRLASLKRDGLSILVIDKTIDALVRLCDCPSFWRRAGSFGRAIRRHWPATRPRVTGICRFRVQRGGQTMKAMTAGVTKSERASTASLGTS